MTTFAEDRTTGLEPVLRAVRRHARLAGITAIVTFIVAAVAVFAYPVKSSATAVLQVYPVAGGQTNATAATSTIPVNISTEARNASSSLVLTRASVALGGSPSAAELGRQVEVDAPDGAQNLAITVRGGSAQQAADRANAVATAYLEHRNETAQKVVDGAVSRLDSLIKTWKASPSLAKEIPQLELARAEQLQLSVEPGALIDPAIASPRAWLPTVAIAIAAGLALAIIVGVAAALSADRLSRRVHDASRLAAISGREVLDWSGDIEGARRLMDRLSQSRPGVPAVVLSGADGATDALLTCLVEVERERRRNPHVERIDSAEAVDTGRATMELIFASEQTSVLREVAPELGVSRVARLADVAVPVLVVEAGTPLPDCLDAVSQLADTRYGVEVVFARKGAAEQSLARIRDAHIAAGLTKIEQGIDDADGPQTNGQAKRSAARPTTSRSVRGRVPFPAAGAHGAPSLAPGASVRWSLRDSAAASAPAPDEAGTYDPSPPTNTAVPGRSGGTAWTGGESR